MSGQRRERSRRNVGWSARGAGFAATVAVIVAGVAVLRPDVRHDLWYELQPKAPAPVVLGEAQPPGHPGVGDGTLDRPAGSRGASGPVLLDRAATVDAPAVRVAGAPSAAYVRLAVAGDVGTGGSAEWATAASMDRLESVDEYAALLLLGDNVYEDGNPSRLADAVFEPFAGVLDGNTQLLPVLGNHDLDGGFADQQARDLGMPDRWYSTTIDDTLIVALDSNQPDNPDQLAWLNTVLAESTARWTIVELHHPPYSGGAHGSSLPVRAAFSPVFEHYGVDLVLSGHEHDYQRSGIIDGVTYIVSGAAAKQRDAHLAGFSEIAFSTFHFLDITIWADRIDVQAVDQEGQILDAVSIR